MFDISNIYWYNKTMKDCYKNKKINLTKICGNGCPEPCKTPWCPTLDNPEIFEDYIEESEKESKEKK